MTERSWLPWFILTATLRAAPVIAPHLVNTHLVNREQVQRDYTTCPVEWGTGFPGELSGLSNRPRDVEGDDSWG